MEQLQLMCKRYKKIDVVNALNDSGYGPKRGTIYTHVKGITQGDKIEAQDDLLWSRMIVSGLTKHDTPAPLTEQ